MTINFQVTQVDNGGFVLTYRDAEYKEHIQYHHSEYSIAEAIEAALRKEAVLIEQQREHAKKERQTMGRLAGIGGLNSALTPAGIKALQEVAHAQAYATAEQPTTSTDRPDELPL